MAVSAASSARRSSPFNFDPASTLGWAVPLILIAPLTIFLMLAIGVRGRRATANVAILGPLLALVGVVLAGWARYRTPAPHDVTYPWLDLPLSTTGASQFQNFSAVVGIRISHASLLLVACALAIGLLALVWSRTGSRGEPAPARYYGSFALLIFATVGVLVATDLLELYTFWGIAGVSTYLLLSHYWTDELATRAARLGLAVPFLTDLALLAGIALLYSRYGQTTFDGLIPILNLTPGAGHRALVVACLLLFAGAAGRVAMFPFQGWLLAARDAPPAALAAIQGLWPLMVTSLLYKSLPIFVAAGPWPLRVVAAAAAVSAILVPLLGFAGLDIRRGLTAAGIGLTSLSVLAFARPQVIALAIAAGAGSGLARAALLLAAATLAAGMRTASLGQMGEGHRRMRVSTFGLLAAGAGLLFLTVEIASQSARSHWLLAYGVTSIVAVLLVFRVYFVAAHNPLVPRRGFDPNRIRDATRSLTWPSIVLGFLGLGLALATYSTQFLSYVDGKAHLHPPPSAQAVWLAIPLLGIAIAYLLFQFRCDLGARVTALATDYWARVVTVGVLAGRLVHEPLLHLASRADDVFESAAETRLAGTLSDAAAVTRLRAPLLTIAVGLAILAVLVAGVFLPGVHR